MGENPYMEALAESVRNGGPDAAMGRAITLIESRRPDHQGQALTLLAMLLPIRAMPVRVGISGGAGRR